MRWLVRGLVVLSVLQFAYIYRLIHHTDEPVSMDIDCNQVPTAKDQAPVSPAVEVPEASPLCGVSLKDVAIFGDEYYATLGVGGADLRVHSGQHITAQTYLESVGPHSITIYHKAIRQIVPLTVAHVSTDKKDDKSAPAALASESFPDTVPSMKGLTEPNIPEQYKDSIHILTDNVLSIRRELISQALNSPKDLAEMHFAVSSKGGFQATKVEKDSLLAGLGLETGDIIQSINNKELHSLSDVMNAYQQVQLGQMLEIRLKRQGLDRYYYYQMADY